MIYVAITLAFVGWAIYYFSNIDNKFYNTFQTKLKEYIDTSINVKLNIFENVMNKRFEKYNSHQDDIESIDNSIKEVEFKYDNQIKTLKSQMELQENKYIEMFQSIEEKIKSIKLNTDSFTNENDVAMSKRLELVESKYDEALRSIIEDANIIKRNIYILSDEVGLLKSRFGANK